MHGFKLGVRKIMYIFYIYRKFLIFVTRGMTLNARIMNTDRFNFQSLIILLYLQRNKQDHQYKQKTKSITF